MTIMTVPDLASMFKDHLLQEMFPAETRSARMRSCMPRSEICRHGKNEEADDKLRNVAMIAGGLFWNRFKSVKHEVT